MTSNSNIQYSDKFQIHLRFQLVKVAKNEFRFVTISESIKIKIDNDSFPLEKVLMQLQKGISLKSLLSSVPKLNQSETIDVVESLFKRRLIEKINQNPTLSKNELSLYDEQIRFFSNFYASIQTDTSVQTESGAYAIQKKIKHSKVCIIGLGKIGSKVAQGLSSIGVQKIIGSDFSKVTKSDTLHGVYHTSYIGKQKESVLKNILMQVNKNTKYSPLKKQIQNASDIPKGIDLLVLCEDTFDPQQFDLINQICLETNTTWVSYRNLGLKFEIGPTIYPFETACFKCYSLRKSGAMSSYDNYIASQQNIVDNDIKIGSMNQSFGSDLLIMDIIKTLTNFSRSSTYNNIFSFNLISFESENHPILRIPRCPQCGASNKKPLDIWQ